MIDLRWAGSPAAIDAALDGLGYRGDPDPRVLDFGPIVDMTVAGQVIRFILIRASEEIPAPAGVFNEPGPVSEAAVGVFMEGPMRKIDPRDWMDRLSIATQIAITAAAQNEPALMRMLLRLSSGQVNLDSEETHAGVATLQAAGLITAEDASALLA